jgi:3-oxoacyl-[acyl-carrier-protein] synthase-3
MNNAYLNIKISNIACYLPSREINNDELALRYPGWDASKILAKTGIAKRYISADNEHISDMAAKAALKLFATSTIRPEDIEILVLCTQTPDYALPGSSYLVHKKLGLSSKCVVFDFNQGCTGFVYGLFIVGSMVHSGFAKNALLITAEAYSKWCHPMDKSVTTLFGDGAAAIHIDAAHADERMGPFLFGSDGSGFYHLTVPSSGSHRLSETDQQRSEVTDDSGNTRTLNNLFMNGPELFRFATSMVPALVRDLLNAADFDMNHIDKFVFHQANMFMLKNLQTTLKIPDEKMIFEIEDIGNTVSSSIPIALQKSHEKGKISAGDRLMIIGFGVGYSWAGTIMKWSPAGFDSGV